ncbi:MAG: hypothetical protein ACXWWO_06435 [Candidatus Limnocylindria bacterium]
MNDIVIRSWVRLRQRFAFGALAGVALLVSHDAVFLAQLGPGDALVHVLRHAAHDYWGAASLALTAFGLVAAVAVATRILWLQRRASALGARRVSVERRDYLGRVARAWLAFFAVVVIAFLIQENLEHASGHGHLIGTGALLGPEYPLALPVIGLITFGAALLGAAIGGAERALVAAIAEVLGHVALRPPLRLTRAPLRLGTPRPSPLAGAAAGRAPPPGLVSIT